MKLRNKLYGKFAIVLALAVIFSALPAIAAARIESPTGKNQCATDDSAIFNFPPMLVNQDGCINRVKNQDAAQQSDAATSVSNHPTGIQILMGDGSVRAVSISISNSPLEYSFVAASDPNAESKARALFDAAYRLRRSVIITAADGTSGVSGRYPAIDVFINDGGDTSVLVIKLQDCIVSSYQISASDGSGIPMQSLSLNFTKIEYKTVPMK